MAELPARVVRGLTTALAAIAAALVFTAMVMIAIDVVRRGLTGRGLPGVIEYTEVLMVGFIFLWSDPLRLDRNGTEKGAG